VAVVAVDQIPLALRTVVVVVAAELMPRSILSPSRPEPPIPIALVLVALQARLAGTLLSTALPALPQVARLASLATLEPVAWAAQQPHPLVMSNTLVATDSRRPARSAAAAVVLPGQEALGMPLPVIQEQPL
jgi:hypothetical protein